MWESLKHVKVSPRGLAVSERKIPVVMLQVVLQVVLARHLEPKELVFQCSRKDMYRQGCKRLP